MATKGGAKQLNEVLKAHKYRIYPTSEQISKLNQTFGCVRVVWNKLVENFNSYGTDAYIEKMNEQTLKRSREYEWMYDVSNCALQQKHRDFETTKTQFFNKKRKKQLGRMNFKNRRSRQSYKLTKERFTLDQDKKSIRLEKIGHVLIALHQEIPEGSDLRSATISKTPSGKFFVSILVKQTIDLHPQTGKKIGIDLGLRDLFILSDGTKISNPRWFRESQTKLKRAQQHLSRKTKGSGRYERQRLKVARIHETITNKRNHFLHNMSAQIVRENDMICIEDLNVAGMSKRRKGRGRGMGMSIADAGWGEFVRQLEYKANWHGRSISKVSRWYPSSKTCSSCGFKLDTLGRNVEQWTCPNCNTHHDRDINAAINILQQGFLDLSGVLLNHSAVPVEHRRGEDVRLKDFDSQMQSSVKR